MKLHLQRRDGATAIAQPTPLSMQPSQYWDGNDGAWSSFAITVGAPAQDIRVMVSTAAYNTWTVDGDLGCPSSAPSNCAMSRGNLFYSERSLTWLNNSIYTLSLESSLGLDTTAYYGWDAVTLGWPAGSPLASVQHSVIANYAYESYWFGMIGINPRPTNFTSLSDPQPSVMSLLKLNNTIPSLSWSYTAGAKYRLNGEQFGTLILGGYDQSKFAATNITIPFGQDISRDLLIGVQLITTTAASSALASSSDSFYAFIDSTLPHFWLPVSVCQAFETTFGLTYDNTTQLYLLNSTLHSSLKALNASVTFTLGPSNAGGLSVNVTLPYAAFDLQVSWPITNISTYYFPLKRATDPTQYRLGRAFLQEAYIIADYERRNFTVATCVWSESATADIRTISPLSADSTSTTAARHGMSTGALVGIVMAVVFIMFGAGVSMFWLHQRRQKREEPKPLIEQIPRGGATGVADGTLLHYVEMNAVTNEVRPELMGSQSHIWELPGESAPGLISKDDRDIKYIAASDLPNTAEPLVALEEVATDPQIEPDRPREQYPTTDRKSPGVFEDPGRMTFFGLKR